MRWRYEDVMALPAPVFNAVVEFANKHLSSSTDLDDLE